MYLDENITFTCNICGTSNNSKIRDLCREASSCTKCQSNVRFRSIIYLLSRELHSGKNFLLSDFQKNQNIAGASFSCPAYYAGILEEKFNYHNTYYHQEPRIDVNNVDEKLKGTKDFIICSEVLEHTNPPVINAFMGLSSLLKPGGFLIFTVPFTLDEECVEHYPNLYDYSIKNENEDFVLYNTTKDGKEEVYKDLVFHGGPGQTIELRLFSKKSIEKYLLAAGFKEVEFFSDYLPETGIFWSDPWSIPVIARK